MIDDQKRVSGTHRRPGPPPPCPRAAEPSDRPGEPAARCGGGGVPTGGRTGDRRGSERGAYRCQHGQSVCSGSREEQPVGGGAVEDTGRIPGGYRRVAGASTLRSRSIETWPEQQRLGNDESPVAMETGQPLSDAVAPDWPSSG
ncbi:hypothetical protein EYF80_057083 [Liparis tanakae]|uniref:Uncharacterized protein n=1 Tax=Liparis tanakae TaxID=230148 RepID=A0A4Z2EVD6_9TELE|nr:hypothetical protein EYF80_057083 [Liparis tanakae]